MEPSAWKYAQKRYTAIDTCEAINFKCVEAAGTGTVKVLSSMIEFYTDDETTLDSTINPHGSGSAGQIPFADVSTFHELKNMVRASVNWECWLNAILPDTSCAADVLKVNASAQAAYGANGYAALLDQVSDVQQYWVIALTRNGPNSQIHNSDAGIEWELLRTQTLWNHTGGSDTIKVYECDDVNGTSTEAMTILGNCATGSYDYVPSADHPYGGAIWNSRNARLVVKGAAANLTGITDLRIEGRYRGVASIINEGHLAPARGF